MCDDLFGHQLFLAHALPVPQHSFGDAAVLEAPQLGARAPQLAKLSRLAEKQTPSLKKYICAQARQHINDKEETSPQHKNTQDKLDYDSLVRR